MVRVIARVFGILLVAGIGGWWLTTNLLAAPGINRKINFQAKVVNTDGTNVTDGNYDFIFKIYSVADAGTSLWSEAWNSGTTQVAVATGIFNVQLGTYVTFPPTVDFNSDSLYLTMNFNGDTEMTPRIRLAAVPYALNAEKVAGLTVTNTTGTLTIPDGKTISFGDNFSTTGVGITLNQSLATTNSVTFAGLSIGGSVVFSGVAVGTGTTVLYISATGNLVAGTLPSAGVYTAGAGISMPTTSSFSLNLGYTNVWTAAQYFTSKVGITGNLNVGGSLVLTSLGLGVGTTVLYIDASGNVVAGTMPSIVNSKVITLSPEYPGASLSADGSGTTAVSMTSDNSLNAGSVGWKNYYQLSSTEASLQDYSVIVRITLPSDFSTWETGSCPGSTCALEMNYQTGLATTADNYISYIVSNDSDTPGTAVCTIGSTAATAWNKSGCTESTLNDAGAPEWDAAGETAVVRIKMAAKSTSSALTRAGDIVLRYRSKF